MSWLPEPLWESEGWTHYWIWVRYTWRLRVLRYAFEMHVLVYTSRKLKVPVLCALYEYSDTSNNRRVLAVMTLNVAQGFSLMLQSSRAKETWTSRQLCLSGAWVRLWLAVMPSEGRTCLLRSAIFVGLASVVTTIIYLTPVPGKQ